MDFNFFQIILVLIITFIAAIDQFSFLESLYRPIVIGPIIGLILGDFQTGIIIGASYELMIIGAMPVGGSQPPNAVIGGIMATIFAVGSKLDISAALPLAVPFAILGQYLVTLLFTFVSPLMGVADKYAQKADDKGIERINYITMGLLGLLFCIVVFAGLLWGVKIGETLQAVMPEWFWTGLTAAGKMMPAIGFAILLKVMLSKDYLAFVFVGFVLAAYLNLPILAISIIGIAIAIYDFQVNTRNNKSKKEVSSDGI